MSLRTAVLHTRGGQALRGWYWDLLRIKGQVARAVDPLEWKNRGYDRDTVRVMRRVLRPTSTCVDVGCFKGTVLAHMVEIAPQGEHYAFEPIPDRIADLQARFPGVHIVPAALAEVEGEAVFHVAVDRPAYSGLSQRPDLSPDEYRQIRVRTARLDDVIPPTTRVDFIKIDVEGGELEVVRGGTRTLRASQPYVVFERGGGEKTFGVFEVLTSCGLRISTLARWLAGAPPLTFADYRLNAGRDFYFLAYPSGDR